MAVPGLGSSQSRYLCQMNATNSVRKIQTGSAYRRSYIPEINYDDVQDWVSTDKRVTSRQYPTSVYTEKCMFPPINPVSHRVLNTGQGKNKLPWENYPCEDTDGFLENPILFCGSKMRSYKSEVTESKPKTLFPKIPSAQKKEVPKKTENPNPANTIYQKPVRVIRRCKDYKCVTIDAEGYNLKEKSAGSTPCHQRDQLKPLTPIEANTIYQKPVRVIRRCKDYKSVTIDGCKDYKSVTIDAEGDNLKEIPAGSTPRHQRDQLKPLSPIEETTNYDKPVSVIGQHMGYKSVTVDAADENLKEKSAGSTTTHKRDQQKPIKPIEETTNYDKPVSVIGQHMGYKSVTVDAADENLKEKSAGSRTPHERDHQKPIKPIEVKNRYRARKPLQSNKELSERENSVAEASRLMADANWENKIKGLDMVRAMCVSQSDSVIEKLRDLKLAVTQQIKNLRSGVSRAAIICLGDMFTHLKKNMGNELDICVKALLLKAGEANMFIREDVDRALDAMVQNVTPVRVLNSLINGGLSQVNNAIKTCAAKHLSNMLEKMGPGCVLSLKKELKNQIFPAIAKCAQDRSPETRFYGQKILHFLKSHPDFVKTLEKHITSMDFSYIKKIINKNN